MLPEIGHFALFLALGLAVFQVYFPLRGASKGMDGYMRLSRYTAGGQFALCALAMAILANAFLTNDFSVTYVAMNSNRQLPAIYRFCAIWGAHEGSLLLWVFILTGWMAAICLFTRSLPAAMLARVLAVLAIIAIGFYLFLLTTSDPFLRLLPNVPPDGADLNPILQDPGLAVHPPILYMGYVGFAVPFAFAMAALLTGQMDSQWARWSRPWTLIAWCFLSLGIMLGSAWAYRELGWGGWWFWDPVENASFLPWLAGTALIHSLAVTEKRQLFKAWTVLLAVCAFSLSLLGTFLVRSGVLVSVHSFAADPSRGLFMLGFLLFVVGGSFSIYAWRGRTLITSGQFTLTSRESLLLTNNILLFVGMVTVLLGTLYPLLVEALHWGKLSVGPPYFNLMFMPLTAPLLVLMAVAPLCRWQHTVLKNLRLKLAIFLVLAISLAIILPLITGFKMSILIFTGLTLSFWLIILTVNHGFWAYSLSQWGMTLAHLGVAITALGILCSTAYTQQRDISMHLGDAVQVGPYQFQFRQISDLTGPNYQGVQGEIAIFHQGHLLKILHPQQRYFPVTKTATAKAAIDAGLFRDLYVALGTALPNGAWSLRIYYKPFIRWIWAGGVFMALGGFLAAADRRYRRRVG